MARKLTTNSRLVNELFANYISTFSAFCELINNSIQAKCKHIWIDVDYTPDSELHPLPIKRLTIRDDGAGVHNSELDKKLLNIGTTNKDGGKGIGRFAAFQLGQELCIETVGYCENEKQFTKSIIPLSFSSFGGNINVSEIDIPTDEVILEGENHSTSYKVVISDLYPSSVTDKEPKKKIIDKFLKAHLPEAIFERYPLKIFNRDVVFYINGVRLDPKTFLVQAPVKVARPFLDLEEKEHVVELTFMQIKKFNKIKVFLTTDNAGLKTIAGSLEYDASWLSPKIGGWLVYVSSPTLPADIYRNVVLDDLDPNWRRIREFIKDNLNSFFRDLSREYENFLKELKDDAYYPYKQQASSKSKVVAFDKLAFLIEDKYHLIKDKLPLRELIYPLIDRSISNGEFLGILSQALKLSDKMVSKFSAVIESTDLNNLIEFSERVVSMKQNIEFLEKLVYSEVSKNIRERKELHKVLERMLWVFGEEYSTNTNLLSDKNLQNNLLRLRDDCMPYKPSANDDNINILPEKSIKSITDLFLYSERILDATRREVLVVELKAPKVKISPKELGQVMKYAREIEKLDSASSKVHFKILLVSSAISPDAQFEIAGRQTGEDNPYFYFRNEKKNIEVWTMCWSDLIENIKRKLNYMSNVLNIKDVDVQAKAKADFADIDFGKISSTLKRAVA